MDRDRLKRDVERIEQHRKEKAEVSKSEREIFGKLKSDGFNCKVVREILKRRGMDDSDGWDAEVATYEAAVQGLQLAADAVRMGATYKDASEEWGVTKTDLHRYVKATDDIPETENVGQVSVEQGDRQSPLRDGEASADITTASALPSPPIDDLEPPSFLRRTA